MGKCNKTEEPPDSVGYKTIINIKWLSAERTENTLENMGINKIR